MSPSQLYPKPFQISVFVADVERNGVSEKDWQMEESIWAELSKVKTLGEIYPNRLAELIANIQAGGPPMYLGTTLIDE